MLDFEAFSLLYMMLEHSSKDAIKATRRKSEIIKAGMGHSLNNPSVSELDLKALKAE